jgi:hypothetical protein
MNGTVQFVSLESEHEGKKVFSPAILFVGGMGEKIPQVVFHSNIEFESMEDSETFTQFVHDILMSKGVTLTEMKVTPPSDLN